MLTPIKFDLADMPGLSFRMVSEHVKLYEGYVKKTNEIREKLTTVDKSDANATFSVFGELKRQETFALNGMKLHEVYFGSLKGDGVTKGKVAEMIVRDFGSVEKWKEEVIAPALSARGWTITAYDLNEKRLMIYNGDAHNIGSVYGSVPVIAIDVYEHAYFIDYGVNRKAYIEAYLNNLNWEAIDSLWSAYSIS